MLTPEKSPTILQYGSACIFKRRCKAAVAELNFLHSGGSYIDDNDGGANKNEHGNKLINTIDQEDNDATSDVDIFALLDR